MTMPDERSRALRFAGEILREMQFRPDVPENLRQRAQFTLRHYPDPLDLNRMIQDVDCLPRKLLDQRWLAPEVLRGFASHAQSGQIE